MSFYIASPDTLVRTLATTWGHFPTQASPISAPELRLLYLHHYLPLAPTAWISLPVASSSLLPVILLPRSPEVVSMLYIGITKPPSCLHPPHRLSTLNTLRISVATPPTVTRLSIVSLYMSFTTVFLPLLALLLPWASPMYRLLSAALYSPWSIRENLFVFLLPSSPLPPKGPNSPKHTVIFLVPQPCKTLPTSWGMPLLVVSVSPASLRSTLRAWYFALPLANHHPFDLGFFQRYFNISTPYTILPPSYPSRLTSI